MKKASVLIGAFLFLVASPTMATPLGDAKARLAALNSGDSAAAIRLLSKALSSGALSKSDRELALVKRGEAYLALGQKTKALADASQALALAPSDAEAVTLRGRANGEASRAAQAGQGSGQTIELDCSLPTAAVAKLHVIVDLDNGVISMNGSVFKDGGPPDPGHYSGPFSGSHANVLISNTIFQFGAGGGTNTHDDGTTSTEDWDMYTIDRTSGEVKYTIGYRVVASGNL